MFGKQALLFAVVLIFLSGCARPEYAAKSETSRAPQTAEKAQASLPNSKYQISLAWMTAQTEEEAGSFLLKFWRANLADQTPVPVDFPQTVNVRLWMPSMNHGSSPVTVTKVDTGTYLVDDVFFSMPGDWDIQIQLKDETGITDAANISVHY